MGAFLGAQQRLADSKVLTGPSPAERWVRLGSFWVRFWHRLLILNNFFGLFFVLVGGQGGSRTRSPARLPSKPRSQPGEGRSTHGDWGHPILPTASRWTPACAGVTTRGPFILWAWAEGSGETLNSARFHQPYSFSHTFRLRWQSLPANLPPSGCRKPKSRHPPAFGAVDEGLHSHQSSRSE